MSAPPPKAAYVTPEWVERFRSYDTRHWACFAFHVRITGDSVPDLENDRDLVGCRLEHVRDDCPTAKEANEIVAYWNALTVSQRRKLMRRI